MEQVINTSYSLSFQERTIIRLTEKGLAIKEISDQSGLAESHITTILWRLRQIFGCSNTTALIAKLIRTGEI